MAAAAGFRVFFIPDKTIAELDMGSARIDGHGHGGPANTFDPQGALDTLDQYLDGSRHPVPQLLRRRALEIATGIAARAPGAQCGDVNGRLRTILGRHGIFINDLRAR